MLTLLKLLIDLVSSVLPCCFDPHFPLCPIGLSRNRSVLADFTDLKETKIFFYFSFIFFLSKILGLTTSAHLDSEIVLMKLLLILFFSGLGR